MTKKILVVLFAMTALAPAAFAAQVRPPYYSIDLATVPSRAQALAGLESLNREPDARAEKRARGYHLRVGAWPDRRTADEILARLRPDYRGARVVRIDHPVEWIAPAKATPAATNAPKLIATPAAARAPAASPQRSGTARDLTDLSLQELLDVQVTSVSKHAEPLRRAAAAVFVLSGDEIRRSGARTIVEALRMVPGLQVNQNAAQTYTVTARGFTADKLEVMLDGRSVYTPLNSSVFWDVLDTYLHDIDRIEVIRGPGATLWGANAVNGVINIVTKNARDTQGDELRAGGGKEQRAFGAFRSGARIGDAGYGRVYAKAFQLDHSVQRDGSDSIDGQREGQAGFRTDFALGSVQDLSVSGDLYKGSEPTKSVSGNTRTQDIDLTGANLLTHWAYHPASGSEISVQAYYDGYRRVIPQVYGEHRDTGDLQLQHRLAFDGNTLIYGAGYRVSHDLTDSQAVVFFDPASRTLNIYSAFLQDQLKLGDGGELTVGSKFEHNTYTGFEVQPGIRLGWALGDNAYTWSSVSRAVRLPNRLDEDIDIFCPPPAGFPGLCGPNTVLKIGNPDFKPEKIVAYEWGLRGWADRDLSADLALFYNDYRDLKSTESSVQFANNLRAHSYGAELSALWAPEAWLTLRPSYAFLKIKARPVNGSMDTLSAPNLEGGSPQHSAGLRIDFTPRSDVTVDAFGRYVSALPRQQVPAYTELGLRLGWKPITSVELALVGGNLLDPHHPESGTPPQIGNLNPPPPATEIERAVWLDVTWCWK